MIKKAAIAIAGLFLASLAHGQTGQVPVSASFVDFSGGLNDYQAPMYLAKNESPNLLNVSIDDPIGVLQQRRGYQTCGRTPSGNTATALYEFIGNDGTRHRIVSDNTSVWSTADCVVYSTITTGLSSLNKPRFATITNRLWIVNGYDYPYVWDGSTGYALDGTSSHPLAPKAKYITYWKSRVFMANTPTDPSAVQFSQLTDTNGNILDPAVSTGAWTNALDVMYINRGDGSPIYGLHLYRDSLYVFKETGVNRIIFESDYNIQIGKNVTTVGCKFNDAIVEIDDGLLRYPGRDGLYAFNGVTASRVSAKWTTTYNQFQQPTSGEQYKLWDTATDFSVGSLLNISTVTSPGSLVLISTFGFINSGFEANNTNNWVQSGGTWTSSSTSAGFGSYAVKSPCMETLGTAVSFSFYALDGSTLTPGGTTTNGNYGEIDLTPINVPFYMRLSGRVSYATGATSYLQSLNHLPTTKLRYYQSPSITTGCQTWIDSLGNSHPARYVITDFPENIYYNSPATFVSEAINATGLSSWRTFDVDQTLNGQSIGYQIRTATSAINLTTTPWRSISPGSIVSTTTQNYVQWAATFTTTDNGVTPLLNSASIGWATGANVITPITAINYLGRYWVSASTTIGGSYNDITMVESRPPLLSYVKHDFPIGAYALWDNNLYGSISGTSKIARLDYGDTDDGNAIHSFWESRDEMFESPYYYKTINMAISDYANTPANLGLNIGLSPDMGEDYQYRSLNISASTLPRNTKKLNYDANRALGFRARIDNSQLGTGFRIYGIHLFGYQNGFMGD